MESEPPTGAPETNTPFHQHKKIIFLLSAVVLLFILVAGIVAYHRAHQMVTAAHPVGDLIYFPGSGQTYLVGQSELSPVSAAALQTRGYNNTDAVPATDGDKKLKIGPPLPLAEGTFYKDGSKTYLVDHTKDGYQKRLVSNQGTLARLGYSQLEVWTLSAADKAAAPKANGAPLANTSAHPDGTLIADAGKFYKIEDGQRHLIKSSAILESYGLSNWAPKVATAADRQLPKGDDLPFRSGSLVRYNGSYYIIEISGKTVLKHRITNSYFLPNLGYNPTQALLSNGGDLAAKDSYSLPKTAKTIAVMGVILKSGQNSKTVSQQFVGKYGVKVRQVFGTWFTMDVPSDQINAIKKDPRVVNSEAIGAAQAFCAEASPPYCNSPPPPSQPAPAPAPAPAPVPPPPTANTPLPPTITPPTGIPYDDALPAIVGSSVIGQVLTVSSNGAWSNNPTSFAYQWRFCGISCTNIVGANGSSYTITPDMNGYSIQLAVTASNAGGANVAYTLGTDPVSGAPQPQPSVPPPPPPNIPPPPTITPPKGIPYDDALPAVSGAAVVGQTLKVVSNGSWSNGPTAFAYQWRSCGLSCTNIAGATGSSYTITADKAGYSIQLAVTASNAGGANTAYTHGTDVVVSQALTQNGSNPPAIKPPKGIPSSDAQPAVSGQAQVGQTLKMVSPGAWSGSPALSYQWRYCSAICFNIAGATGTSYFITANMVGYSIQLAVTGTNASGTTTVYTLGTDPVTAQPVATAPPPPTTGAPTNISLPVISGQAKIGSALSVSPGSWSSTVLLYKYQWQWCLAGNGPYPDGVQCYDIALAAGSSLTITSDLQSKDIRVKVTASNSKGSGAAISKMVGPVAALTTDAGSVGGGGVGVTDQTSDPQWLASQILKNTKVTRSGAYVTADLQAAAAGKVGSAGAKQNTYILLLIYTLSKNHSLDISSLESNGQGHASNSAHYTGDAVDIDSLDNAPLKGRDSYSIQIINLAAQILPSGSAIGQSECGYVRLPAGFTQFIDVCNHLHLQVPHNSAPAAPAAAATPPTLIMQGPPSINGQPVVGSLLVADPGKWVGNAKFQYHWQRCPNKKISTDFNSACINIGGASKRTYTVSSADANHKLRVEVMASQIDGSQATLFDTYSDTTNPVTALSPDAPPSVQISANPDKNVPFEGTTTLTWKTVNAVSCTASSTGGGWNGPVKPNDSQVTPKGLLADTSFTLTCTNANGSNSSTTKVSVVPPVGNPNQFPLRRIGWTPNQGAAPNSVAVLDTGVASVKQVNTNPGSGAGFTDPNAALSSAVNFNPAVDCNYGSTGQSPVDDPNAVESAYHGTAVSQVIGGQFGVAPGTKIDPIKVSYLGPDPNNPGKQAEIFTYENSACGIEKAIANKDKVINMSFRDNNSVSGDTSQADPCNRTIMRRAVCDAAAAGVILVASAGNNNDNSNLYGPANYPEVITVTAIIDTDGVPGSLGPPIDKITGSGVCGSSTDASPPKDDYSAPWSSYADGNAHALAAPGCIYIGGGWFGGTSAAAPVVAAIAARCGCMPSGVDGSFTPYFKHNYGPLVQFR